MIGTIDLYLLDRVFNPFYLKLYKRFGFSNFTLAKYLIMVGAAVLLLIVTYTLTGKFAVRDPLGITFLSCMECYFAYPGVKAAIAQEEKWKNPTYGMMPENFRDSPRKEVYARKFFLFVVAFFGVFEVVIALYLPGNAIDLYRAAAWLPILLGFYFLGCTPPGPRTRAEREFQKNKSHRSSVSAS